MYPATFAFTCFHPSLCSPLLCWTTTQTQFALENIKDTADHISSMKHARDTLQDQYKKLDINSVEDLQDDLADLMADADEINEIMGRSYGVGADIDEADLDEELAGLDEELGDLDFGDMSGVQDSGKIQQGWHVHVLNPCIHVLLVLPCSLA